MKVFANVFAAVAVSSAFIQGVAGCGTLKGCFVRDLKATKATGKAVEFKLMAGVNAFEYVKGSSEYSIRCDVDGYVAEVEFGFEPEGTTHKSWGAPFWISGSWGDWVEKAEWLQFCGTKSMSVKAKTWTSQCFADSYSITMNCGGATPTVPKTSAPIQSPPKAPTGDVQSPTKIPIKSVTKAPAKPPTTAPVRSSTGAPVRPPTESPIKSPTESPVKSPTDAPTGSPVKAPSTELPTSSPTAAPTDSPTISPTELPTSAPTQAPTAMVTPAPTAGPADSDVACNGKPLFFKEKPCLSGLLKDYRLDQDCSAANIRKSLRIVFNDARNTKIWGHYRRDLGAVQNVYFPKIVTTTNDVAGDCPWDFEYEVKLLTGTLSNAKADQVLEKLCSIADDDSVRNIRGSKWTDVDRRMTPTFMDEYTDGGTDLNNEIGNFQNPNKDTDPRLNKYYPTDNFSYTMGLSIDRFYRGGARATKLEAVDHLDNCDTQTIMCCFGNDRQYDDNNGNCAKTNCDDAKPADNTDICYAGGRRYQGDETAHCHGFAWSNNKFDPSSALRFNSFFYVLMHDHLYTRGYVKSVKPNTLMCSCLENMPIVSRSDCSELDLKSTYLLSIADGGNINVSVDRLAFEWNACKGYQPGTKTANNNDLLGRVEKLYQEGHMELDIRRKVSKTLVQNCKSAGYRD